MLESRFEDALVKVVKTAETLETVQTVETVETAENMETLDSVKTVETVVTVKTVDIVEAVQTVETVGTVDTVGTVEWHYRTTTRPLLVCGTTRQLLDNKYNTAAATVAVWDAKSLMPLFGQQSNLTTFQGGSDIAAGCKYV